MNRFVPLAALLASTMALGYFNMPHAQGEGEGEGVSKGRSPSRREFRYL